MENVFAFTAEILTAFVLSVELSSCHADRDDTSFWVAASRASTDRELLWKRKDWLYGMDGRYRGA
jgi:hypothetical protein